MLRVEREADGRYRISLPQDDALVLEDLPRRLRRLFEKPDFRSKIVRRLFPAAYADKRKEAEYRKLLGDDLHKRKLQSIDAFEKSLAAGKRRRGRLEITIAADEFELWLGFVNDMRLVLGTELEITDEGWSKPFDRHHPQALELALLHYLSWLEEELLRAAGAGE